MAEQVNAISTTITIDLLDLFISSFVINGVLNRKHGVEK